MKFRVLWVEDDARFGLTQLAGPVYVDGRYDLVVAGDVSTAVVRLLHEHFDAVIVDIRLPPGEGADWENLYSNGKHDKVYARLGLHLLRSLLGRADAKVSLKRRPDWLTSDVLGVFTVESHEELGQELESLGIRVYQQKRADLPDSVLLDILERILSQQGLLPVDNDVNDV